VIVLDSSFIIGFHNGRDGHHNTACTLMERFLAGEWGRGHELDLVPCFDLFSDALEVFKHQGNTRLSFADAAIAHVAQERAGGLLLTFDEEFRKLPGIHVPRGQARRPK